MSTSYYVLYLRYIHTPMNTFRSEAIFLCFYNVPKLRYRPPPPDIQNFCYRTQNRLNIYKIAQIIISVSDEGMFYKFHVPIVFQT